MQNSKGGEEHEGMVLVENEYTANHLNWLHCLECCCSRARASIFANTPYMFCFSFFMGLNFYLVFFFVTHSHIGVSIYFGALCSLFLLFIDISSVFFVYQKSLQNEANIFILYTCTHQHQFIVVCLNSRAIEDIERKNLRWYNMLSAFHIQSNQYCHKCLNIYIRKYQRDLKRYTTSSVAMAIASPIATTKKQRKNIWTKYTKIIWFSQLCWVRNIMLLSESLCRNQMNFHVLAVHLEMDFCCVKERLKLCIVWIPRLFFALFPTKTPRVGEKLWGREKERAHKRDLGGKKERARAGVCWMLVFYMRLLRYLRYRLPFKRKAKIYYDFTV